MGKWKKKGRNQRTAKNTTPSTSFAALATKLEAFGKSLPDAERELLGRLVSTSPLRSELTDEELGQASGGTGHTWGRI